MDEVFDESSNLPYFIKLIIFKTLKLFNMIIIKENIIILPFVETTNISNSKLLKFAKKINIVLKRNSSDTLALSTFLNEHADFRNYLYAQNLHILDGRWLFKFLSIDILNYIAKMQRKNIADYEVSILSNSCTSIIQESISLLSQKVKILNVISNNIEQFKPIANDLYNSFGISIKVSNNKRKALFKSNVILNFDFSEDVINKYSLPPNTVIVNMNNKISIGSKLFNGINANFYNVHISKQTKELFVSQNLINSFSLEVLYESLLYGNHNFSEVLSFLAKDNVKITCLIGNNGVIDVKEFNA